MNAVCIHGVSRSFGSTIVQEHLAKNVLNVLPNSSLFVHLKLYSPSKKTKYSSWSIDSFESNKQKIVYAEKYIKSKYKVLKWHTQNTSTINGWQNYKTNCTYGYLHDSNNEERMINNLLGLEWCLKQLKLVEKNIN